MTSQELHFVASLPFDEGQTVRHARRIEALGFEYIAVGEHYMQGRPPLATSASLPILGVAAGATENIRLLSSVLLVPFYHPLLPWPFHPEGNRLVLWDAALGRGSVTKDRYF